MKQLLLCLLFVSGLAKGQGILQGLPVDSTTGKICYQGVVQAPGATKAELYARAREWAATVFNSARNVLQMDDKESGVLIAKGFVARTGYMSEVQIWRTVKVYTKEGRYRYEVTDFYFEGPAIAYAGRGSAERELEIASAHGRMKVPKAYYKFLLESISNTTEPEIASLRQAMVSVNAKAKDF